MNNVDFSNTSEPAPSGLADGSTFAAESAARFNHRASPVDQRPPRNAMAEVSWPATNHDDQQRTHEWEALFQAMLQTSVQGIVVHQDSIVCFANAAAARLFDFASPDGLLGQDVFEALSAPEERAGLRARTHMLLQANAQPTLVRWRALSRCGAVRWVQTTAKLITWNDRPAVAVFFQDLTAEQRAVQALHERETLLHAITDHTDDMIFVKDRDSRVLYINPAGLRAIGLQASKVVGHKDDEFISDPDMAAAFRATDLKVMESRHAKTIEEEVLAADGQRRLFLTRKTPRMNADGDVIGVFGVTRDITEERRLQREILQIAGEENRRMGQDLHDGAGQQLTALAYMCEALRSQLQDLSLPEAELAERLVDTVKKTQRLIRGFSRGLIPVDVEAEGLRFALDRLAESTTSVSGIRCHVECPQPVRIDNNHVATQLYRIAQEAVTNALRHARAKHIAIELVTNQSRLRLSISDDGIGTPPEEKQEGSGLRIMRYRAGLIGASLHITPERPHGTRVSCVIAKPMSGGEML